MGPLTPPLLVDTTALYATLSGSAAVAINLQSGAIVQTPASSFAGTVYAQDAANLYVATNLAGSGSAPNGEILSITKGPTMSVTGLTSSQSNYSTYDWIGIVAGSANPLCAHWSGNPVPTAFWNNVECGSPSTGALTVAAEACSWSPTCSPASCTLGASATAACGTEPTAAAAADSAGLFWNDGVNLYMVGANVSAPATTAALPGSSTPGVTVLDASYAYWYDTSGYYLFRTSRSTAATTEMQYLGYAPGQLAVDASYLYWTSTAANRIMRMPVGGGPSTTPTAIAPNQSAPTGIAVYGGAVYWINSGTNAVMKMASP